MPDRYLYLARHGEAVDEQSGLTGAGREQARLLGRRMSAVPLTAVLHSPVRRAAETAELVGAACSGVPLKEDEALGDHVPPVPDTLPDVFERFLADVTPAERAAGAALARAATDRYARPADAAGAPATHELIITHSFMIGWFVRHALDAPDARWLGLNHCNCAVTAILYRAGRPPSLLVFNDQAHLPGPLRWTGFPPTLTA